MQSATQAAEEAVRAILGSDGADEIGIRWAQDKIVGILHNGHPLGEREWRACAEVDLPVVDWSGSPAMAWLISVGKMFRCSECSAVVSSVNGADDDMPGACDACWNSAHKTEALIPPAVAKRLAKAAEYACAMNRGACIDDLVRHAAEILGFDLITDALALPADEKYGATLAAHCGTRPWDELSSISRALWVERAKRLRKRWTVDEHMDPEGNVALRRELFGEPEWSDKSLTVQGAAASCIARLRRHRDCLMEGLGSLAEALSDSPEWREALAGTRIVNVALAVIERQKKAVNQGAGIALTASKLVAAWEQNGLSGLASHVYDLRAALEKYGK